MVDENDKFTRGNQCKRKSNLQEVLQIIIKNKNTNQNNSNDWTTRGFGAQQSPKQKKSKYKING